MSKLYGSSEKPSIWENHNVSAKLADSDTFDPDDVIDRAITMITQGSLYGAGPVQILTRDDELLESRAITRIEQLLDSWDAKLISVERDGTNHKKQAWVFHDGALWIKVPDRLHSDSDPDNTQVVADLRLVTKDETKVDTFSVILREERPKVVYTPSPSGMVYMLSEDRYGNVELTEVGVGSVPLERDNYPDEVLAGFDRAVADILSDKPHGRLIVLDGPPGTGKTYMVRAFMGQCPETKFVIIPPQLVSKLAEPKIITGVIRDVTIAGRPIVLVLEDADQCLSKRKAKNMSSISSILNLSDGIVGSLLDVRILATTNTPAQEFDVALLRKGRMSAHIKVGDLDFPTIERVWRSLVGDKVPNPFTGPDQGPVVLADIYAAYNELSDVDRALADVSRLVSKLD